MASKLAIFDKDGTLTTPRSGENFVQAPDDQIEIPGMPEIVRELHGRGYKILVASNQGGVDRYKTESEAFREMRFLFSFYPEILKIYFAPGDGQTCCSIEQREDGGEFHEKFSYPWIASYRKPAPGMLAAAFWDFRADPGDCFYCGDRQEDFEAAQNAGCGFYWLSQIQSEFLRAGLR